MTAYPAVHINGSYQDNLFNEAHSTYHLIVQAIISAKAGSPNSRDYPEWHAYSFHEAAVEHDKRIAALEAVANEYYQIMAGIMGQREA